ncbi:MAG: DUF2703 domain-containing protein [Pyrinomonadaceae bacterium]
MTETKEKGTGCGCSGNTADLQMADTAKLREKRVEIEFLYLDLESCDPCRGTDDSLEEALSEVSGVIGATGAVVDLKKIHVTSYEQALDLGLVRSPTIRVNGRDLALEVRENHCSSCSEISGTETFCRVWDYEGREYQVPPKELIVESILREVYGSPKRDKFVANEKSLANLKAFFNGTRTSAASCGSGVCG